MSEMGGCLGGRWTCSGEVEASTDGQLGLEDHGGGVRPREGKWVGGDLEKLLEDWVASRDLENGTYGRRGFGPVGPINFGYSC